MATQWYLTRVPGPAPAVDESRHGLALACPKAEKAPLRNLLTPEIEELAEGRFHPILYFDEPSRFHRANGIRAPAPNDVGSVSNARRSDPDSRWDHEVTSVCKDLEVRSVSLARRRRAAPAPERTRRRDELAMRWRVIAGTGTEDRNGSSKEARSVSARVWVARAAATRR